MGLHMKGYIMTNRKEMAFKDISGNLHKTLSDAIAADIRINIQNLSHDQSDVISTHMIANALRCNDDFRERLKSLITELEDCLGK